MFKVIRKQTRPNVNVPFWQGQNSPLVSDEFKTYFLEKFISTGKFISTDATVGNNGLELTVESLWESEAAYDEFTADATCIDYLINVAESYCNTNGILSVEVSKAVV
jgi:hypothetical protein